MAEKPDIISAGTCPFAQRSRMALIEKGVDFNLIEIDLDAKPDWFLKISPYGKVPVVRQGDDVIFESAIINEYLEEMYPEPALLPKEPAKRARARIWIDMANVRFTPHIYKLMLAQDPEVQKFYAEKLTATLKLMEKGLAERDEGPFWMGKDLTLVDVTFFPHVERLASALEHYRGIGLKPYPLLGEWLEMMQQRDSVKKTSRGAKEYIKNWRKYAENTSTGTTAEDMRDAPQPRSAA